MLKEFSWRLRFKLIQVIVSGRLGCYEGVQFLLVARKVLTTEIFRHVQHTTDAGERVHTCCFYKL